MKLRGSLHLLKLHTQCWLGSWVWFPGRYNALRGTRSSPVPQLTEETEAREEWWCPGSSAWWRPVRRIPGSSSLHSKEPHSPHKDRVKEGCSSERQFHLNHMWQI